MDRRGWIVLLVTLACSTSVMAGRLYGTVQVNGRAVPEGQPIYVICPPPPDQRPFEQAAPAGTVNRFGRYSVEAPASGDCAFAVRLGDGRLASIPIISFRTPTRYNFIIRRQGDSIRMERRN